MWSSEIGMVLYPVWTFVSSYTSGMVLRNGLEIAGMVRVTDITVYLWYGHQGAPDVVEASVKSHLVEDFLRHPGQRTICTR